MSAAYRDATEAAYFAAMKLAGALLAARAASDPSQNLAIISMSAAMESGVELARHMKAAADLVNSAAPANDRMEALAHGA